MELWIIWEKLWGHGEGLLGKLILLGIAEVIYEHSLLPEQHVTVTECLEKHSGHHHIHDERRHCRNVSSHTQQLITFYGRCQEGKGYQNVKMCMYLCVFLVTCSRPLSVESMLSFTCHNLFAPRKLYQTSKPEMEFHMTNIIYAALSMRAQTGKTRFSCKDDCTLTKPTRRWTYPALQYFHLLTSIFGF